MTVLPLYLLAIAGGCAGLEIAAFNVQVFGQTKFEKTEVVDLLSKVRLATSTRYSTALSCSSVA